MRIIKWVIGALIVWGVIRGFVHYNNDTGGTGIARLVNAFVGGVEDATYKLIPVVINLISSVANGATK